MDPKLGDTVLFISQDGGARPAIVTIAHTAHCLNLFILPDVSLDHDTKMETEYYSRTLVLREDHVNNGEPAWRPLPG